MKMQILSILLLCAGASNNAHAADSNAKTDLTSQAPATLPANYKKTLTELFKNHESFAEAAGAIRALATQDAAWKPCLADAQCAGKIIKLIHNFYPSPNNNASEAQGMLAASLGTTGSFDWCKSQSEKKPKLAYYLPLFLATACQQSHPNIDVVTHCLQKGINVNATAGGGTILYPAALPAAAMHGHTELVKLLLDHNANIEIVCPLVHCTPLMAAAYNGRNEIVDLLITRKANVNNKNRMGMTALKLAQKRVITVEENTPYKTIIELLKNAGAQE